MSETPDELGAIEDFLARVDAELDRLEDEDEFRSDPTFLGPR